MIKSSIFVYLNGEKNCKKRKTEQKRNSQVKKYVYYCILIHIKFENSCEKKSLKKPYSNYMELEKRKKRQIILVIFKLASHKTKKKK